MTPMERVEYHLRAQGETLAAFAVRLGVRSQDINNWKRRGIPRTKQQRVADALGWSLDRLLGNNDSFGDRLNKQDVCPVAPNYPHISAVPEPGAKEAGLMHSEVDGIWQPARTLTLVDGHPTLIPSSTTSLGFPRAWLAAAAVPEDGTAVYYLEDESMQPMMRAGDLVLVDCNDRVPSVGRLFVVGFPGAITVRRLFLNWDGAWLLRAGYADRFPDQRVSEDHQGRLVSLLGRVRWRGGFFD